MAGVMLITFVLTLIAMPAGRVGAADETAPQPASAS
jgi:hypothetical protein